MKCCRRRLHRQRDGAVRVEKLTMSRKQRARWRGVAVCGVFMLLLTAAWPARAALHWREGAAVAAVTIDIGASADSGPLGRFAHRLTKRAENSVNRLSELLGAAGFVWLSILLSVVVFLFVTAVSSVADFRMFA